MIITNLKKKKKKKKKKKFFFLNINYKLILNYNLIYINI